MRLRHLVSIDLPFAVFGVSGGSLRRRGRPMRAYVQISGIVFGLAALGHLARLFGRWPLLVAGYPVPALASVVVVVGAGAMAFWAWRSLSAASPAR